MATGVIYFDVIKSALDTELLLADTKGGSRGFAPYFSFVCEQKIEPGKMPVNMVLDPVLGYKICNYKRTHSTKWPAFQVRELMLHPATERVSECNLRNVWVLGGVVQERT